MPLGCYRPVVPLPGAGHRRPPGRRRPAPPASGSVRAMSLSVAVPCALLSAVAYGTATAVQHTAAHTGAGRADASGLLRLLRNPRWLMSVLGDGLGLVLQICLLYTSDAADE